MPCGMSSAPATPAKPARISPRAVPNRRVNRVVSAAPIGRDDLRQEGLRGDVEHDVGEADHQGHHDQLRHAEDARPPGERDGRHRDRPHQVGDHLGAAQRHAPEAHAYPPGWGDVPGAAGCTVESLTYARRAPDFAALGVAIRGLSTQRPDQLDAFAAHARLPFPLVSDQDSRLAGALRLPTFRVAGTDRFKRLTLLVDPDATVRAVQFPVTDPAGSVDEMLDRARVCVASGR